MTNKPLAILDISLLFTTKCNAECSHCGFSCSPREGVDADLDMLKNFSFEAYNYAQKTAKELRVHLTGGEPFLRYNDLLELVRYIKDLDDNIRISSMTNAFWATSVSQAKKKLQALRQVGCKAIGISVDDFHIQNIGIDKMRNAVKALIEIQLQFAFKFNQMNNKAGCFKSLSAFDDLFSAASNVIFEIHSFNCIPVGRASDLPSDHFNYLPSMPQDKCQSLGNYTLAPDGKVGICCGNFDFSHSLVIGKYPEKSLEELITASNRKDIYKVLKFQGPAYYAPALDAAGYPTSTKAYTHLCDLCRCVFENAENDPHKKGVIIQATRLWREDHDLEQKKVIPLLDNFLGGKKQSAASS
jgi:organic radical activating enzyme